MKLIDNYKMTNNDYTIYYYSFSFLSLHLSLIIPLFFSLSAHSEVRAPVLGKILQYFMIYDVYTEIDENNLISESIMKENFHIDLIWAVNYTVLCVRNAARSPAVIRRVACSHAHKVIWCNNKTKKNSGRHTALCDTLF